MPGSLPISLALPILISRYAPGMAVQSFGFPPGDRKQI